MSVRNTNAPKRSRLSAALIAAIVVPFAGTAFAQEASESSQQAQSTSTLDKVTVTGRANAFRNGGCGNILKRVPPRARAASAARIAGLPAAADACRGFRMSTDRARNRAVHPPLYRSASTFPACEYSHSRARTR